MAGSKTWSMEVGTNGCGGRICATRRSSWNMKTFPLALPPKAEAAFGCDGSIAAGTAYFVASKMRGISCTSSLHTTGPCRVCCTTQCVEPQGPSPATLTAGTATVYPVQSKLPFVGPHCHTTIGLRG